MKKDNLGPNKHTAKGKWGMRQFPLAYARRDQIWTILHLNPVYPAHVLNKNSWVQAPQYVTNHYIIAKKQIQLIQLAPLPGVGLKLQLPHFAEAPNGAILSPF